MPKRGALGGPRVLLRRLREVMAEPVSAQERLDKIVVMIAANMVAEVCSVYVLRVDGSLELYATEGLSREAVHITVLDAGEGLVGLVAREAEALNLPNLKVQFDAYHCQMSEGNVATRLQAGLQRIGHIQIAGVPGRHEPDIGELHYPFLFAAMDALGYIGWVGCEYRPRAETRAGLGWLHQEEVRASRKPGSAA